MEASPSEAKPFDKPPTVTSKASKQYKLQFY
jgi:hypothetical protein